MRPTPASHLRVARPSRDLEAAGAVLGRGPRAQRPVPGRCPSRGRPRPAGGTRVPARNPYWDEWGVTIADPDGYRLVLSRRSWPED